MEARQAELDVPERIVTGDIADLSISGRSIFKRPLIVVLRIHDVFVLFGMTLTASCIFEVCGRTIVAARRLDVLRTDVVTCHAIHIFMSSAC